jgi:uncharacterized protein
VLHRHGLAEVRVRHHGDLARLELPLSVLGGVAGTDLGLTLAAEIRAVGYRFVTLDLEGFRSGSGSEVLPGGPS